MTPQEAYLKCNGKINKKLEPIIIKSPVFSYRYARYIIKYRWLEAEDIISTNSYYSLLYSVDVIRGRLPEIMHNAMLIHADVWAKNYFDFIKNKLCSYSS
jgi:hypothetical protein